MAKTKKHFLHLNAGEWSPKVYDRIDHEKYEAAMRTAKNVFPLVQGPLTKRKGFEYIAAAKYDDRTGTIIKFQFSRDVAFAIEVGHEYMRFYLNGAQVQSGGSAYEIATPYQEDEVFELDYVQKDDVIWIAHKNHALRRLIRLADDNWTLTAYDLVNPPMLDVNADIDDTLALSATTGTGVTMTAVGHTPFLSTHVGSYWSVSHIQYAQQAEMSLKNVGTLNPTSSQYITVLGEWSLETTDFWTGTLYMMEAKTPTPNATYDASEWTVFQRFDSNNDRNFAKSGDQEGTKTIFAMVAVIGTGSSTSPKAYLRTPSQQIDGVVQVTGYTSSTVVTVDVKTDLYSTNATDIWAEGAWSGVRGYPQTIAFFEQRIWLAGTTYEAQKIWASEVGEFDSFKIGTLDTDGLAIALSSQERNEILWLADQDKLLIGTTGGEWVLAGTELNSIISPSNIVARRQETNGSDKVRPIMVNEQIMYVQRTGRKVREFGFDLQRDRHHGVDLLIFSEHLTQGGIKKLAYQTQPDPVLYCVDTAGVLLSMVYEKDQNLYSWTRHETDGTFESIETIFGADGEELYAYTNRTINGTTRRFIERMDGYFSVGSLTGNDLLLAANFVDCGVSYEAAASVTVTGLDHLDGEEIVVVADGFVYEGLTVAAGSVTLPTAASVIHAGLPYEARIKPMPLDADPEAGIHPSITKRVTKVFVRVMETLGMKYNNGDREYEHDFRKGSDLMDQSVPLFTGEIEINLRTGFTKDPTVELISADPLPFTLRSMTVHYEVTEE